MKPGISGRNGPLAGKDGEVSARIATPHTEKAANGEKVSITKRGPTVSIR